MNDSAKLLLPLLGVILGWGLSEWGKINTDKRQDKRKLKRLLFYLLELRFHFTRELSLELDIEKCIALLKTKLIQDIGFDKNDPDLTNGIHQLKPFIIDAIAKSAIQNDQLTYLENNIDTVLVDLSEVSPILAYELNGQHNIKERLAKTTSYFKSVSELTKEMPFNLEEWVKPKLTKEIIADLDSSLDKIASAIDRKISISVKSKITKMDTPADTTDLNTIVDELLEKIKTSLPGQIQNGV